MRQAFAHEARMHMGVDQDDRALGGAVTLALCGSWEHEPPCPLAPHHSSVRRDGEEIVLRVLFAADADREAEVRDRIEASLSKGEQVTPDGAVARWRLLRSAAGVVGPAESALAQRLVES